jgi:hypothetical protein
MVLLLLLRRCLCYCCTSVVFLAVLMLLLSLRWHCHMIALTLSYCCAGFVTNFFALGIVAIVAMLLLLLRRFLCLCCAGMDFLVALQLEDNLQMAGIPCRQQHCQVQWHPVQSEPHVSSHE